MKKNIINLADKRIEKGLPTNIERVDSSKTVRIPVLDKFYQIDGEWMYEVKDDNTPRKWKDYSHMDFN